MISASQKYISRFQSSAAYSLYALDAGNRPCRAAITIPGVNAHVLNEWFRLHVKVCRGGVAALFNIFAGGALEHCAIFRAGIMPYISASI